MDDDDLARLFATMARIRAFETELGLLWEEGRISGELHLGVGEEAAVAGVVDHLVDGDALALDHRSTPPLVARGTDPVAVLLELLGAEDGLCHGMGGHMHLFDPERLAASSGIVGAAGPIGCGFALAASYLRPGAVAVAFFGEGAANQGMLMESLNLASVWTLPLVFVCKDSGLAVTTRSCTVTAGRLDRRAGSFDIPTARVDGADVAAVWRAAGRAVDRARAGRGPTFLHVRCSHPDGHMLTDPLVHAGRGGASSAAESGPALRRALTERPGAALGDRLRGLAALVPPVLAAAVPGRLRRTDPLARARRRLGRASAERIEAEARRQMAAAVQEACRRLEVTT